MRFADVTGVFDDENALTVEQSDVSGEVRYVTIGLAATGEVVVVVYTFRNDKIRVISARRAEKPERRAYEAKK